MSFLTIRLKRLGCFGSVAILLFGLVGQADGQSGRRAIKPLPGSSSIESPPVITETPGSHTPSKTTTPSLQRKVKLLITRRLTKKHLQSEDVILASFVKRLNEFTNVKASPIGDVKGDEATIRAKAETESFVVLLSFDIDNYQNGTIILNSPDLEVEYVVLAPRTARKETKGKIYFQAIGGGRMRRSDWPGGTPIKITPEATGIQAAEQVHDWLLLTAVRNAQP
jgi:hypothetical protein